MSRRFAGARQGVLARLAGLLVVLALMPATAAAQGPAGRIDAPAFGAEPLPDAAGLEVRPLDADFHLQAVGRIGAGRMAAVAINWPRVYVGLGNRVAVVDVSTAERPTLVGMSERLPESIANLAVSDTVVYVADGVAGLWVLDARDPAEPRVVATYDTPGNCLDVAVVGDAVYVADGPGGLIRYAVADRTTLVALGQGRTAGSANGLFVSGLHVFVAAGPSGLRVHRADDLVEIAAVALGGYPARAVFVRDGHAYVAWGDGGFRVVDVRNPASPVLLSGHVMALANDVLVEGSTALVADRDAGLRVVDVADPARPLQLTVVDSPGNGLAVVAAAGRAYLADGAGLQVVDISRPAVSALVASFSGGDVLDVMADGRYAYVAAGQAGLRVVDIADPSRPRDVGAYSGMVVAHVDVVEGRAYVTDNLSRLQILDVTNPGLIRRLGGYDALSGPGGLVVQGHTAFIADGRMGLRVIDVADPAAPRLVGYFDTPGWAYGVDVAGTFAYVADGDAGLRIVDVSNPALPTEVAAFGEAKGAVALDVTDNRAVVAIGVGGMVIVDVTEPLLPRLMAGVDTPGKAQDVSVSEGYAYLADGSGGLRVIDVLDPGRPREVVAYATVGTADRVVAYRDLTFVADQPELVILQAVRSGMVVVPRAAVASTALADWPADRLADGRAAPAWSSTWHADHLAAVEWAAVILDHEMAIDTVWLTPRRSNTTQEGLGFPQDFVIQYALNRDGLTCDSSSADFARPENWRPLVTRYGYDQPVLSEPVFRFPARRVECVRVLGVKLSPDDYGIRYLQLAEIDLWLRSVMLYTGRAVVSSEIPGWPAQRLVDGEFHRAWSSRPHGEHLASTEWAALILDGEQAINGLRLWPRTTGASPLALGFPKDLVVQYARETTEQTCNPASSAFARPENWRPLTTRYGLDQPGATWVPFDFGMVTAACVRVVAVSLSQDGYGLRYLQLAEMEALQNGVTIRPAQVAVSSEIPSWPSSRLGDGDRSTVWSSRVHGEFLDSTEWAAILLPSPQVIDALRVTPRVDQATGVTALGFPQDFVVQYAASGGTQTCDPTSPAFGRPENWRPLVMRYGYAQPSARPEVFAFSPVTAECVRLFGTELSSDDYGIRYLQLAEIEALRRDVASQ